MNSRRVLRVIYASLAPLCLTARAQPDAPAPAAAPQAPHAGPVDVSDTLAPILERFDIPAASVLVVRAGVPVAQGVAGVRAAGHQPAATLADRWHLGSCTKSMTATLCAILVEEGTLRWDTKVLDLFPELRDAADASWQGVTLERLLTQTAGAPKDLHRAGLWARLWKREGTPTDQRLQLLREVLTWKTDHEPGSAFLYSNTNFAVAGAMAERATGKPWEDLMQQRVFAPLGITTAGFGAPGTACAPGEEPTPDQPWGHNDRGTAVAPGPSADNPAAIGPGGTAHMSLPDWGRYVSAHLSGETPGRALLLTPESYKRLHEPALSGYASGWSVTKRPWAGPTGRALTHAGSNTMWYCVVWMAPEKDMAVLVACNRGGDQAVKAADAIAASMIRTFVAPTRSKSEE